MAQQLQGGSGLKLRREPSPRAHTTGSQDGFMNPPEPTSNSHHVQ